MSLFIVRTTAGRERQVGDRIILLAEKQPGIINAILNPELIKGYLFVESSDLDAIKQFVYGMHHVKGVIDEPVTIENIKQFITSTPKEITINEGDIVELISGPFKGEKAKVKRINKVKEEIVVELLEAAVPIPMSIGVDSVRVIMKKEGEPQRIEQENEGFAGMINLPANIKLIRKSRDDKE